MNVGLSHLAVLVMFDIKGKGAYIGDIEDCLLHLIYFFLIPSSASKFLLVNSIVERQN